MYLKANILLIIIVIVINMAVSIFMAAWSFKINAKRRKAEKIAKLNNKMYMYLVSSRTELMATIGTMMKNIHRPNIHAHTKARLANKIEKEQPLLDFLNQLIKGFDDARIKD